MNTWEYNGNTYKVGESLKDNFLEENNCYPIVWYEKKLYKAIIKPESPPRIDRIGLQNIYYPNNKLYWTTIDKVFHVIKIK